MVKPTIQMSGGVPRPLPLLRSDVQVFRGPDEEDGSPTYNVKDPVSAKYYKFNWEQGELLRAYRPGMTAQQLVKKVNAQSTLKATVEDVETFWQGLGHFGLLVLPRSSEEVEQIHKSESQGWLKWLALHYLYIRIPLLNPDSFLERTLPYVKVLFSRPALILYISVTLIGLVGLFQRFDEFLTTFDYFFNFKGLLAFALALTAIKVIHEFSHAYTAKNYGIHVPTMGVVLLVFWPVLYTDVTDGWKLYKRRSRLAISVAGIVAELMIAGVATFAWTLLEPGVLQSVCFVVASSTWLSTLAVNLNPALRFDGYYILSDIWGIDNLQWRAFAVTRWRLHQLFLGLNAKPPEEGLSKSRIRGMMVYSIYTWIYRVFLYIAIALLVYYKFAKVLGIVLFLLEIAVFFVWPISSEVATLWNLRSGLKINWRLLGTLSLLALALLWFSLPISRTLELPAVIVPVEEQLIMAPRKGVIKKVFVRRGQWVNVGDPIIQVEDRELDTEASVSQLEVYRIEAHVRMGALEGKDRHYISERSSQLISERAKLRALQALQDSLLIRATVSGRVHDWSDELRPGLAVATKQVLARVANPNRVKALAFVPEEDWDRMVTSNQAFFRLNLPRENFEGDLQKLPVTRQTVLNHFSLASLYQGDLAVIRDDNGELKMVKSYFPVEVMLGTDAGSRLRFGQSGTVISQSKNDSALQRFYRRVRSVLIRESQI